MPSAASRLPQYVSALVLVVLALVGLYGFFPYFEGYGSEKSSLTQWLWNAWHGYQGEWIHGMLVPFIVLFLVGWEWWFRLDRVEIRPSHWGLVLILLSLFAFWVGYCADVEYFGWASLQLIIAGVILWFLGVPVMKGLLFPWAFLIFMFPMPFLDNMLAFPLRLFMTHASHLLLMLLGVANDQVGTGIFSAAAPAQGLKEGARFAIDIADPCSGIYSLFALSMLGALFAHFMFQRAWQKWLLFLAVIPLAIIGNIVRILILTFATLRWGSAVAIGSPENPTWIHEGAGYAVFLVALLGIIGCGLLLDRLERRFPASARREKSTLTKNEKNSWPVVKAIGFAALSAGVALLCFWSAPPTSATIAGVNLTLPDYLGDWWGFQAGAAPAEKALLPPDTEIVRKVYESPQQDHVTCTIVLSGAQRQSIHRPEICLPGQGWVIRSGEVVTVPLHSGKNLQVMNLTITRTISLANGQKTEMPAYFMYWFVGDQVTTPYHWQRLWLTSWDRIIHHINHRWAYVSILSPVTEGLQPHGKNATDTLVMLKAFVADILPTFQKDGK